MSLVDFINLSAFNIGAIFLAASCMAYTLMHRNVGKPHNTIYFLALCSIIISAICNMIVEGIAPYCGVVPGMTVSQEATETIYFLVHNFLALCVCYYAIFASESYLTLNLAIQIFYIIPFAIAEIVIILNPFTHWAFYFDQDYRFVRGLGEIPSYIAGAFYICVATYYLVIRWMGITRKRRAMIVISILVSILGVLIQAYNGKIDCELFAEAITFMGIMLAVEYEDDRVDAMTGVYNRQALIQDIRNFFSINKPFSITAIRVVDEDLSHSYDSDKFILKIASFLKTVHWKHRIYRANATTFVLVSYRNEEVDYIPKISAWIRNNGDELRTVILTARAPKDVIKLEDALLVFDGNVPEAKNGEILEGDDLDFLEKSLMINRALDRAIEEDSFEVCYQPIFEKGQDGIWKMRGVEALVRLHDDALGELMPGDFISAAERNGTIAALGEHVFKEALSFIESGECGRLGIDYININLSEVQCMKSDFAERMCAIAGGYMASPERIRFELEESIISNHNVQLPETIRKLKEYGFSFVLEDFGSGYSGILSSYMTQFDAVKIDKKMLWNADKSRAGKIVIENCIKMIHDQGKKVSVIGVETEEHRDYLDQLGVETMQGFYFSRPVTRNALATVR